MTLQATSNHLLFAVARAVSICPPSAARTVFQRLFLVSVMLYGPLFGPNFHKFNTNNSCYDDSNGSSSSKWESTRCHFFVSFVFGLRSESYSRFRSPKPALSSALSMLAASNTRSRQRMLCNNSSRSGRQHWRGVESPWGCSNDGHWR